MGREAATCCVPGKPFVIFDLTTGTGLAFTFGKGAAANALDFAVAGEVVGSLGICGRDDFTAFAVLVTVSPKDVFAIVVPPSMTGCLETVC